MSNCSFIGLACIPSNYYRHDVCGQLLAIPGFSETKISNYQTVTLENLTFTDTDCRQGGAIAVLNMANTIIRNIMVVNSTASADGGAIFLKFLAKASIDNVQIFNTFADRGGAVFISSCGNISLTNFYVRNSSSTNKGGLLYSVQVDNLTLSESNFQDSASLAGEGGGPSISQTSLTIESRNLTNTSSPSSGGAIYASRDSSIILRNVMFNGSRGTRGGGIYMIDSNLIDTEDVAFLNMYTSSNGVAFFLKDIKQWSLVRIQVHNSTTNLLGAIYGEDTVPLGVRSIKQFTCVAVIAKTAACLYLNTLSVINIQDSTFQSVRCGVMEISTNIKLSHTIDGLKLIDINTSSSDLIADSIIKITSANVSFRQLLLRDSLIGAFGMSQDCLQLRSQIQ